MLDLRKGFRVAGAVVNIAAAGVANAVAIFQQSNSALQIGTKTFRIKRLKVRNNAGGNLYLHVGTGAGAGFVDRLPPLYIIDTLTADWVELDLPEYDFAADCTAYPATLVAGGSVDVQVEVEEIG